MNLLNRFGILKIVSGRQMVVETYINQIHAFADIKVFVKTVLIYILCNTVIIYISNRNKRDICICIPGGSLIYDLGLIYHLIALFDKLTYGRTDYCTKQT